MSRIGDNIRSATGNGRARINATGTAARQKARDASKRAGDRIDNNPLAIVLGGVALGAIIGAFLPTTKREAKMLGKTGKKLNKKARKMAEAAKDAGKKKVDSLGLNGDMVREQFRDLVAKATEAVRAAGEAAGEEARKKD